MTLGPISQNSISIQAASSFEPKVGSAAESTSALPKAAGGADSAQVTFGQVSGIKLDDVANAFGSSARRSSF